MSELVEKFFIEGEKYAQIGENIISHLRAWEQSFTVIRTTRSTKIKYLHTSYYYSEIKLSTKALSCINRLRKEVRERMSDIEMRTRQDVRFYSLKLINAGERLYEYDLTAAYVHALHELKLCSEDLYIKLLDLEKRERLAVVGSLATKKIIEENVCGKIVSTQVETQDTEPAWWTICHHVDQIMIRYMEEHSEVAAGYWVDAFFSRKPVPFYHEHRQRVVEVVEARDKIIVLDDKRTFPLKSIFTI